MKDLFRLTHLKWIAAYPINHISPRRHSAVAPIIPPRVQRAESEAIFDESWPSKPDKTRNKHDPLQTLRESTISEFDSSPDAAWSSLVISRVPSKGSPAPEPKRWRYRSLATAGQCGTKHPPRINDIKLPKTRDIRPIENGSLIDSPRLIIRENRRLSSRVQATESGS